MLATTGAVIAGITYNFLPFMILPLYASLERLDKSMLEAAYDLYASRRKAFMRVTLPLSAARHRRRARCSRSSRRPATSSTPSCWASSRQYMIGNVIQSRFLVLTDYPTAAALSFLLMAAILGCDRDLGAGRRQRGADRGGGEMSAPQAAARRWTPDAGGAAGASAPRPQRAAGCSTSC